jgi:hypothetical protein
LGVAEVVIHQKAVGGVLEGELHVVDQEGISIIPAEAYHVPALQDFILHAGYSGAGLHVAPVEIEGADVGIGVRIAVGAAEQVVESCPVLQPEFFGPAKSAGSLDAELFKLIAAVCAGPRF